jgi:hypothetical protein
MILGEMIRRAARGDDQEKKTYLKAVVLAVDLEGGKLQNPNGEGSLRVPLRDGTEKTYKAMIGPKNPRGSVKARVLTDGLDRLLGDQDTRVFWPMFPQDLAGTPATPGEHVYIMFDGVGMDHGLWISRVAGHESAGSADGTTTYTAPSAPQSAMDTFEENGPTYPRDDAIAGLAPTNGAMTAFEED